MKTINETKKILAQHTDELTENYKIKKIGIFGSYIKRIAIHKYRGKT